jgi:hypothetical protein
MYKISPKETEGPTSIIFGNARNSQPFSHLSPLISSVDIVYLQSSNPENQIQKDVEKNEGVTLKFLDKMVDETWMKDFKEFKLNIENEVRESHFKCARCEYWADYNLDQIYPMMKKIQESAREFYDLETAQKLQKINPKHNCPKIINKMKEKLPEKAINEQNQKWMKIKELIEDLKTKKVLIAVEYPHLLGHGNPEFGLIELLKKESFEVEPIPFAEIGLTLLSVNEKEYHDQIQKAQNKIIDLCRPAFHKAKMYQFTDSITLKDLKGDWYVFGDAKHVILKVKDDNVTVYKSRTIKQITETDEKFMFGEDIELSKRPGVLQSEDTNGKIIDWGRDPHNGRMPQITITSPITLKDLEGDWYLVYGTMIYETKTVTKNLILTVQGTTVTIQETSKPAKIKETDENFYFGDDLVLSKASKEFMCTNPETEGGYYWNSSPFESDILVQVYGLKNDTKYNGKMVWLRD